MHAFAWQNKIFLCSPGNIAHNSTQWIIHIPNTMISKQKERNRELGDHELVHGSNKFKIFNSLLSNQNQEILMSNLMERISIFFFYSFFLFFPPSILQLWRFIFYYNLAIGSYTASSHVYILDLLLIGLAALMIARSILTS